MNFLLHIERIFWNCLIYSSIFVCGEKQVKQTTVVRFLK